MMRLLLLLILLLAGITTYGQQDPVQRILQLPRTSTPVLTPSKKENTILIPSTFAQGQVNKSAPAGSGEIVKVYYIYTKFKQSPSFDQKKLDAERIQKLGNLYPEILKNRYIEWELVEQTGCNSPSEGTNYFHGFVLVLRPEPSAALRDEELQRLETFFKNPSLGFQAPDQDPIEEQLETKETSLKTEENHRPEFPNGDFALFQYFRENIPSGGKMALNQDDSWVNVTVNLDKKGKISGLTFPADVKPYLKEALEQTFENMPNWEPAIENQEPVASKVDLEIRMSFSPIVRGMYNRDGAKPNFSAGEVNKFQVEAAKNDAQVAEQIERVENTSVFRGLGTVIPRENIVLVMDVTASMSPYLAALNWWVANSADSSNIVQYVFFNDGDGIEDRKKKVGETGGIHHGTALINLTATMMHAMQMGNGGDAEENDLEAILKAQEWAPNSSSILLIADNFSEVRDMSLLPEIHKKVHVLIGGDVTVVRESYLDLAKTTGGDIIVNGRRISLQNLAEGERILIGTTQYTWTNNHFRMV